MLKHLPACRKVFKHLLFFVLFFGCQLLAERNPKTTTRVKSRLGRIPTVPSVGLKTSSSFKGLETATFSVANQGQQQCAFKGLFRMWSNKSKRGVEAMRRTLLSKWRQASKGKNKKINQINESDSDKPSTRGHPVGDNGSARGRKESENGGVNRSEFDKKFHQECLEAHNMYRDIHEVPPLKLNDKLSEISQRWAQHLADIGSVAEAYHSHLISHYGENILTCDTADIVTGLTTVQDWYSEINDYDFKTGTSINGGKIGHFTQLVWKESKEMGVGVAFSSEGYIFVVCNYYPPGNWEHEFTRMVPPVGGFSEEELQRQAEEDAHQTEIRSI